MGCAAPSPVHWEDLRNRPRDTILQQEGVQPASQGNGFEIGFLDASYLVDPQAERIVEISPLPGRQLTEEFQILLIRYLVAPNGGPPDGEDVSEKDLPGGVTFFQGPHALYVGPIARLYGEDPEAFEKRARELHAVPVPVRRQGHEVPPLSLHARDLCAVAGRRGISCIRDPIVRQVDHPVV